MGMFKYVNTTPLTPTLSFHYLRELDYTLRPYNLDKCHVLSLLRLRSQAESMSDYHQLLAQFMLPFLNFPRGAFKTFIIIIIHRYFVQCRAVSMYSVLSPKHLHGELTWFIFKCGPCS